MKFIYMTDPHIRGGSPSTRLDDYSETILGKVSNWLEIGNELGVDFFLCGGDIFDSPHTSNRVVKRFIELLDKGLGGKELFFVWGNHDVHGWNPNTAIDTSMGLVASFYENVTVLSKEPTKREYDGVTVSLTGVSSYAMLDKDVEDDGEIIEHRSRDYILKEKSADVDIHVVHGYLSLVPILEDIPHTVVSDMKETKADFTLTGHEHTGFPPQVLEDGRVICNPGALGRVFASITEMNRMPQYFLGEYKDGKVSFKLIPCPVARSGDDIMDRKALDEKKKQEILLKEAKGDIKEILSTINVEKVDLDAVLQTFKGKVEEKYYDEAIKRLEEQS